MLKSVCLDTGLGLAVQIGIIFDWSALNMETYMVNVFFNLEDNSDLPGGSIICFKPFMCKAECSMAPGRIFNKNSLDQLKQGTLSFGVNTCVVK
jgi:hypothetical protein